HELGTLGVQLVGRDLATRLRRLREAVSAAESRRAELLALGVTRGQLLPTIKYLAALRVSRDLVQQGWTLRVDDEGIYLHASALPNAVADDPGEAKQVIRRWFSFARDA